MHIYAYCAVSSNTLRQEALEHSPIQTQIYYSEPISILETNKDWVKVQASDNSTGWMQKKEGDIATRITPFESTEQKIARVATLNTYFYLNQNDNNPKQLPFRSRVRVLEKQFQQFTCVQLVDEQIGFVRTKNLDVNMTKKTMTETKQYIQQLVDMKIPFLYGGRTVQGLDCSALVQMIFSECFHIQLPRNSRDQFSDNRGQDILEQHVQEGDLVFFKKGEAPISHVGLCLGDDTFVHADTHEGCVTISKLSNFPSEFTKLFRRIEI